ncbi:FtsX-like permease family protein [Bifidobacterium sp. SMB2]|uniref:FtsX-like permease family protein n=1 Tax=Bifidobacterium saimiriisciurei TaxID=2661627 RepID=A0ABX0CBA4_9BIFI|nr:MULTISPECIES: ABC transporter permease [Bifidobacterium]NEG96600.1 FtsX-like permease family protein [Bifidobacterium sp. SMB2]NEH12383.1 FtsX-like permease family protein [Bifidobacterium saimiriisciurei]
MSTSSQHRTARSHRASRHRTALWKDSWRAIATNGKRFAAIVVICAVGIMMLCGLNSVSRDIRGGLDDFFDRTSMHDIAIVSTLGFDDDDIAALRDVAGVDKAAGVRAQNVTTKVDGRQASATVTALNDVGVDRPYLAEGRLPDAGHEIAVTRQYLDDSGRKVGDAIEFASESSDASGTNAAADAGANDMFADGEYIIVGVVIDPNDIVNPTGPLALVSGAKTVYPLFVDGDAVTGDTPYTSAVITVDGAAALNTYDDDYLAKVADVQSAIETMQDGQERHRTDAVKAEALKQAMKPIDEQKRKVDAMPDMLPMKAVAEHKIADAEAKVREKIDGMDDAKWIIRDRSAVTSYEDVKTQSEMISRLGTMFPVLFLVIALLVSLTAMARMVEEDRQLIGTYKALGYRRGETMLKYLVYSLAACLLGGVIGDILGMVGLPFVFTRRMLTRLYVLPEYPMIVDWRLAVGGVLLFVVIITGAAMATCAGSLRLAPAELMRPKAPKAGRTIMLQRVGIVWNHLSFLGKVTARNLFRYKSRALMVIVGVLGCTALMTAGFGIGNSALTLMPRQYSEIVRYDVMAVTAADDHDDAQRNLDDNADVASSLPLQVGSVTLAAADGSADSAGDAKLTAQIMVVPDGESIADYIDLHTADGQSIALDGAGSDDSGSDSGVQAVVTANAAKKLGLTDGSKVNVTDMMADSVDVRVAAVAQYYTGNVVFMTQNAYEKAFDADIAPNADLIKVKGDADGQIRFADDLAEQDEYLSVMSSAKQQRDFAKSFATFFVMIGFIVAMAAILAIVVLYTLASTNISERARELATIKVLGFRRGEVHGYVNKEMLLLSAIGIAVGLPGGRALLGFLVSKLDLPGMNIVPNVQWFCYAAAAVLALLFTLLVGAATNRSLDRIDMVAALKSPE